MHIGAAVDAGVDGAMRRRIKQATWLCLTWERTQHREDCHWQYTAAVYLVYPSYLTCSPTCVIRRACDGAPYIIIIASLLLRAGPLHYQVTLRRKQSAHVARYLSQQAASVGENASILFGYLFREDTTSTGVSTIHRWGHSLTILSCTGLTCVPLALGSPLCPKRKFPTGSEVNQASKSSNFLVVY